MKIGSLFEVIRNANDLVEYFEGADTPEQMVSRLERLKKAAPDELVDDVKSLRDSISKLLDDTMEMGRTVEDTDDDDLDNELSDLEDDDDAFDGFLSGNDPKESPPENSKTDKEDSEEESNT